MKKRLFLYLFKKNYALGAKHQKLIVEFAQKMAKEFGTDPNEFVDNLAEQNFNFYEVWWYDKKIKRIKIEKLKDYVNKNVNTNLLCIKEKPNDIIWT